MTILYRFNNRFARINGRYAGSSGVVPPVDPYNPLGLPPYTLRFQFGEPVSDSADLSCNFEEGYTWTKVDDDGYIWDWTYEDPDWSAAWDENQAGPGPVNILGGNTTGVTSMYNLFFRNSGLVSCATFDTSSVENFEGMFTDDSDLTVAPNFDMSSATNIAGMFTRTGISSIPNYDLSNVTDARNTFAYCENVASGALAAYSQLSNGVCEWHAYTFTDCGFNTVTGASELAQIPADWGGNQTSTWTCWNCSNENQDSVDYCDSCCEYRYGSQATDWNCNFCGGLNGDVRTVCYNCNHDRYSSPTWYCSNCGQGNDDNDAYCWCCGEYRPTPTSDWNCNFCGTTNGDDQTVCYACNHDRYSTPTWWCTNCGNPNGDEDSDCWNCGEPRQ